MKQWCIILFVAFNLQSCIKVKSETLECGIKLTKPIPSASSYMASLGQTINLSIINEQYDEDNYYYKWIGPEDFRTYGPETLVTINSNENLGDYKVVYYNSVTGCASDTAVVKISLAPSLPNCGMYEGEYKVSANASRIGVGTGYTGSNNFYYYVDFYVGSSSYFTMRFGTRPPSEGTTIYKLINYNDAYNPADDECAFEYNANGVQHQSLSGNVYVRRIGTYEYQVLFCNATVFKTSTSQTLTGSAGNLVYE